MSSSIGLITLNAKFIHSSLSIRYLRNVTQKEGFDNVWIQEFVISQPIWKVAAEILSNKPDVLGISVYIWNRGQSFELIERLKKQDPSIRIVIGGPEVSFDMTSTDQYTVIAGEGEKKWIEFLEHFQKKTLPSDEKLKDWESYGENLPELTPAYIKEDLSQLKKYQKSWKDKFGKEFEKQRISRKILERIDNKTIDSLFDTITPEMVDEISDKDDFDFHTSSIVKLLGIRKSLSAAQNIMSSELRRLLTS